MRLLPSPYWDAWKAHESGHSPSTTELTPVSSSLIASSLPTAGYFGLLTTPIILFGFKTLPLRISAWSCMALVPLTGIHEVSRTALCKTFFREQGLQVPQRKLYDNVGITHLDDFTVLGGVVGTAVALRRPWALRGWQSWLGAMCIGSTIGGLGYSMYFGHNNFNSMEEFSRAKKDDNAARVKWETEIDNMYKTRRREQAEQMKTTSKDQRWTAPAFLSELAQAATTVAPHPQFKTDDGPHWKGSEPGEFHLMPQAYPNYKWTAKPEEVVPKLEHHIAELRAHREKLADQCGFLWRWLIEKEEQYYRLRDDDRAFGLDVEDQKHRLESYCQTLSAQHAELWVRISNVDWIIADTQKRIQAHQRRLEHGAEETPLSPPLEKYEERRPLTSTLASLDSVRQRAGKQRDYYDGIERELVTALADPKIPTTDGNVMDSGQRLSTKQQLEKLLAQVKESKRRLRLDQEAVDLLVKDLQEKSGLDSLE